MGAAMADEIEAAEILCIGDVTWVLQLSRDTVARLYDSGTLKGPPRQTHRRFYTASVREYIGSEATYLRRLDERLALIAKRNDRTR